MVNRQKILIVDDDNNIAELIALYLTKECFETMIVNDGESALSAVDSFGPNLMLLDLMLPGMMGEELIREIRRTDPDLPIIVLSAKSGLEDRVSVLELGADDYLVKPFAVEEVWARVAGALRRSARRQDSSRPLQAQSLSGKRPDGPDTGQPSGRSEHGRPEENGSGPQLQFKELTLDTDRREVRVRGQLLNLTAREYDILHILMQEPGKVYSRERLYELVWQGGYYGEDNTVNVHVSNLRKKIAAVDSAEYIATVWGIGFRMA